MRGLEGEIQLGDEWVVRAGLQDHPLVLDDGLFGSLEDEVLVDHLDGHHDSVHSAEEHLGKASRSHALYDFDCLDTEGLRYPNQPRSQPHLRYSQLSHQPVRQRQKVVEMDVARFKIHRLLAHLALQKRYQILHLFSVRERVYEILSRLVLQAEADDQCVGIGEGLLHAGVATPQISLGEGFGGWVVELGSRDCPGETDVGALVGILIRTGLMHKYKMSNTIPIRNA